MIIATNTNKIVLAIHGGAGALSASENTQDLLKIRLQLLDKILVSGYQALINGASALDVVMQAIMQLECISI